MERTNTTTEQSYDFSEYSIMSKEDFEKHSDEPIKNHISIDYSKYTS